MGVRKWNRTWETIGKIFIDLGKLFFGSLILGTILKGEIGLAMIFAFGFAASLTLFVLGVFFVHISEE